MLISEIMALFCDEGWQDIEIYNCDKGETIYRGEYDDYEGEDYEISGIDNIGAGSDHITFNV